MKDEKKKKGVEKSVNWADHALQCDIFGMNRLGFLSLDFDINM